jgi:hypothetical protein
VRLVGKNTLGCGKRPHAEGNGGNRAHGTVVPNSSAFPPERSGEAVPIQVRFGSGTCASPGASGALCLSSRGAAPSGSLTRHGANREASFEELRDRPQPAAISRHGSPPSCESYTQQTGTSGKTCAAVRAWTSTQGPWRRSSTSP